MGSRRIGCGMGFETNLDVEKGLLGTSGVGFGTRVNILNEDGPIRPSNSEATAFPERFLSNRWMF